MSDPIPAARADIVDQLHAAFRKVTGQEAGTTTWSENAHLRDDLGLDSFAALELLFELEDRLGIRIAKAAAASFQTVGDVVNYVMAEREASKPAQSPAGESVAP